MALKAGARAYLAGDDHAFYICSRKYVYVSDALTGIADRFVDLEMIDSPDDIRFLYLGEIKTALVNGGSFHSVVAERKERYAKWSNVLPPDRIGSETSEKSEGDGALHQKTEQHQIIKGESGTRKNARGRIQVGFPKIALSDDIILLLEHGHEGDITAILDRVAGIILKMGSPACHMGIIARELGIPAIYGVGDGAELLKQDDQVELLGKTGEVVLLDKGNGPS